MTLLAIPFPPVTPELIEFGPIVIRWYALGYIFGLLFAWWYLRRLMRLDRLWPTRRLESLPASTFWGAYTDEERARHAVSPPAKPIDIDDFLVWATLGVIIGGRLGSILFYDFLFCGLAGEGAGLCGRGRGPEIYLENPLRIFAVWQGGMSFHGGFLGVVIALVIFTRRRGIGLLRFGDLLAISAPVGIFLVRITNFINAELWGKVSTAPWAVIFCNDDIRARFGGYCPAGELPRHPVQIYEALLEGALLFAVLFYLTHYTNLLRRPGLAIGIFLSGYTAGRIFAEFFKDSGTTILGPLTMGMALSVPMAIAGAFFIWHAYRPLPFLSRPATPAEK